MKRQMNRPGNKGNIRRPANPGSNSHKLCLSGWPQPSRYILESAPHLVNHNHEFISTNVAKTTLTQMRHLKPKWPTQTPVELKTTSIPWPNFLARAMPILFCLWEQAAIRPKLPPRWLLVNWGVSQNGGTLSGLVSFGFLREKKQQHPKGVPDFEIPLGCWGDQTPSPMLRNNQLGAGLRPAKSVRNWLSS